MRTPLHVTTRISLLALSSQTLPCLADDNIDLSESPRVERLEQYRPPVDFDARFDPTLLDAPTDKIETFKEHLINRYGLDLSVTYSPSIQGGSVGSSSYTAAHEVDFIGSLNLVDSEHFGKGALQWWVINIAQYSDRSTSSFANELGIISTPNGLDLGGDPNFTGLPMFWWEQQFNDSFKINIGKLALTEMAGINRFAHNDREDFLSTIPNTDPTAAYTANDSGIGFGAKYAQEDWYLSGIIADGSAEKDWLDFSSLGDGNWQYIGEFGLTPEFDGLGEGNYRFTVSSIDEIEVAPNVEQAGWGVGISIDQNVGENHAAIFRYSRAVERMTDIKQSLMAGWMFLDPFGCADDLIGVAGWWADPYDPKFRNEYGLELFWRMQLTDHVQLSPDIQVIFQPAKTTQHDVVAIGGMRLNVTF